MDPDRDPGRPDRQAPAALVQLLRERVEAGDYRVSAELVAEAILAFHLGPEALGSRSEPPSQSTT